MQTQAERHISTSRFFTTDGIAQATGIPRHPRSTGATSVGDLGMVRNHSYSVNVTAIKGLGTAISDYEAPIVPPADTKEQYVSYKVNILKWAVVPRRM